MATFSDTLRHRQYFLLSKAGMGKFFVGGPNEKSKMSGGPTYFFTSHLSKQQ
jgi:hypothetical protein